MRTLCGGWSIEGEPEVLKGRPLTAVIPLRGGSRGIPGKNMYMMGGISLLERTIRLAARCPPLDRPLVPTVSPDTHQLADRSRVVYPPVRLPPFFSSFVRTPPLMPAPR